MSLLQLPQSLWREKIVFFLKDVLELVRLDSAIINRSDRTAFLSNISGCKRFCYDKKGGVSWFVLRNLIVDAATFSSQLLHDDALHLQHFLGQAKYIEFREIDKLSTLQTDWLRSNALVDLIITDCDVENVSALSVCGNLVFLELSGCTRATTESFVEGIQGCTKLQMTYIRGCTLLRESAVVALLLACVKISDVHLSGQYDLNKVFSEITQPTSVTSLCCADQQTILTGSVLRTISTAMPQIRSLDLSYPHNTVVDADIEVLGRTCDNLKSLQMYHCTRITNAVFSQSTTCLARLCSIYIDYCWSITNAGIIALAHYATSLRTLRLTNLEITDVAVQAVGTHCRNLRYLDVTDCRSLTDNAFSTLNMAELYYLDVSGTPVTGTFAAHIYSTSSIMRRLHAVGCAALCSDFVHSLPVCYVKPVSLRLGGVNRLTESDWLQLSTKFPCLHTLEISYTATVNDAIAQSFKSNCPKLRSVTLTGCNVSEEVRKMFA